jgi:pyruvate,water dikinase
MPGISSAISRLNPLLPGTSQLRAQRLAVPFAEIGLDDLSLVGGKNASLGEMIRTLGPAGVRVPDGFAITTHAYRQHLREAGLTAWVQEQLRGIAPGDTRGLATAAAEIRRRITEAPLPNTVREQAFEAYARLSASSPGAEAGRPLLIPVAVRSSATAEDLPTASFAGQQESYLNVQGQPALDLAIRKCMASLFTDRAIVYRVNNGIPHHAVSISVGVQRMVRSDIGSAGTMFTLDTESGFRGVVLIDATWGLGEALVKGRVRPDEFWVHKATLREGHRPIIRRELGDKRERLVRDPADPSRTLSEPVPPALQDRFSLQDDEVLQLARWAVLAEAHASSRAGREVPLDIEWGRDGDTGELFLLQSRPETVHTQAVPSARLERFRMQSSPPALLTGKSVGTRVGSGRVRVVRSLEDLHLFQQGEVLVAEATDPDWEPVLRKAAAVVTERGGRTCHAAIVSREMRLPCVVGAASAMHRLADGQVVTVSCAEGDVGRVYGGSVPFTRIEIDPDTLPPTRVPLLLNVADPGSAFSLARWPAAGVGLLRTEFLVSDWIGMHPMAAVHPERVADPELRRRLHERARGHVDPAAFVVSRLAEGMAQFAAAFHPRPVVVRFSDFKTSEYARLEGGTAFEPHESNPMIGFRGASRYAHNLYREGFALECEAIRRVRRDMGLTNLIAMVPFCRTLAEARLVLEEMGRHGLSRGADGLQVWMMAEIPSNALMAREFAQLFDGFSIGSNDLTQLTLGIDRDSSLLAAGFEEGDPAVRKLIRMVIEQAHAAGRKVSVCGEAPSRDAAFAAWLVDTGIDSISIQPDALVDVTRAIAASVPAPPRPIASA